MQKALYILFVFTVLFSCKKKVIESNILIPHEGLDYIDCNCPSLELDIETLNGNPDMYREYDATNYLSPQINPNNSDEIAFIFVPFDNEFESQLIIYNTVTQEKRILINGKRLTGKIAWGKKDWILFQTTENHFQLYKIKSNGDSLTPIGNGQWFFPSWNATGDKFVVNHRFNSPSQPRTFILNENGEVVNSITSDYLYHNGTGDWSHPDYYLRYDAKNIYLMDLEENKVLKHIKAPSLYQDGNQKAVFGTVGWLSHSILLFNHSGGLYTYNLTTNKVTHIRCFCGFSVLRFACNPNFSNIVIHKLEKKLIENNQKHFIDHRLFLLDPITLAEEEIIIP